MENTFNDDGKNNKDLTRSHSSLKSTKSLEKSSTSGSFKSDRIQFKEQNDGDNHNKQQQLQDPSLKVPHKFIANWRQACDRTKDRTKDLLKRWRTLPEIEAEQVNKKTNNAVALEKIDGSIDKSGWSVHVWTTWVDRFSRDSESDSKENCQLTPIQNNKFSHFFTALLDHDQDNLISEQDFETLIERLRHFADWSISSTEFNILREVERGFIDTFLSDITDERFGFVVNNVSYLTREGWLCKWSELITGSKTLADFPIWLQFFVKVLFQIINRCGTGIITKDELSAFYSSALGLDKVKANEILNIAYQLMTSNGDHPLVYKVYRLCFANYLLGRYPNGPGQYILGATPITPTSVMFPVDYSALNAQAEDLEQYAPGQRSSRRSVIV